MKHLASPLAATAWRSLGLSFAALLPAALLLSLHFGTGWLPGVVTQLVVGLSVTFAWLMMVRFLLLDTWGRRVWLVVTAAALLLAALAGPVGLGFALFLSFALLSTCRYRTWRHISDRRRAVGFGLGLVAMVLLMLLQRLWSVEGTTTLGLATRNLGTWSIWSMVGFWVFSLFHLAVRMRLHFLRLRSKLAVSAVLIGVVPLAMMVLLGLMILYTTLGGARAARLVNTLDSWQAMTASGSDLSGALFDTTFVWPDRPADPQPRATRVPAPAWVPQLADGMRRLMADEGRLSPGRAPTDTTDYFVAGGGIWLMRWQDLDTDQPAVKAWLLGTRPLRQLSGILKAGLDLNATGTHLRGGQVAIDTGQGELVSHGFNGLSVSYRDRPEGEPEFWNKYLFFGGTFRDMLYPREDRVGTTSMFIQLRVGWPDLTGEFVSGGTNLNKLVVFGLALAAFMWLVIEVFAVFFGVRISEGIVAGVHALHRGTRAVAAGNLEARIEIPNEDEFGDLAASFNEMTLAVRHGRQIALANERMQQELATARSIQVRLLPRDEPRLHDFEVTGASIPSREIGGDYYDYVARTDDMIGVAIGDVSGKGMPAALLMSNLQASLHGQVLHPGSVSGVVERVNNLLVRSTDPHMFATFFYGLLDASTATFTCTNAGHNPPLLLRSDGSLQELTTGGLLLGMLGEQPYLQDTVHLEPGEVIVLYTDGITEAVGPSAEEDDPEAMFGEEALREVIRRSRHLPAAGIQAAILAAVNEHTTGVAQSDDITLVVIRRQG